MCEFVCKRHTSTADSKLRVAPDAPLGRNDYGVLPEFSFCIGTGKLFAIHD